MEIQHGAASRVHTGQFEPLDTSLPLKYFAFGDFFCDPDAEGLEWWVDVYYIADGYPRFFTKLKTDSLLVPYDGPRVRVWCMSFIGSDYDGGIMQTIYSSRLGLGLNDIKPALEEAATKRFPGGGTPPVVSPRNVPS